MWGEVLHAEVKEPWHSDLWESLQDMALEQQKSSREREMESVERGGKEKRQSQKTWHNWLYTLLLRWETGNVHLSVLLSPPALISNLISPKSPWKDP